MNTVTQSASAAEKKASGNPSPKMRILIAEDDALTARVYASFLEKAGYEVQVAKDGPSVLPLIGLWLPHGILLDIMLPGLNGIDVLKFTRASDFGKTIPVVVVTNAFIPEFVEGAKAAGANKVFSKAQLTPREILEEFRMAFSHRAAALARG
jgi:CheY-like chemotaxis protein